MRAFSHDVDRFKTVAELYFKARENDGDEEEYDSPWDDENSSDSGDEEPTNEDEYFPCVDNSDKDLSEKAKGKAFFTNTCNCKFGEGEKSV